MHNFKAFIISDDNMQQVKIHKINCKINPPKTAISHFLNHTLMPLLLTNTEMSLWDLYERAQASARLDSHREDVGDGELFPRQRE